MSVDTLTKEEFAALPKARQVEITAELLKRGDFDAIKNLGIEIMTDEEWLASKADGPPDVIEIKNLN